MPTQTPTIKLVFNGQLEYSPMSFGYTVKVTSALMTIRVLGPNIVNSSLSPKSQTLGPKYPSSPYNSFITP